VKDLPSINKTVVKYLLSFLSEVASHSAENKMTSSNLSIVFGPNLLRPQVETIETSLRTGRVNTLFQLLIDHCEYMFA
jgi:hypothetical protein